MTPSAPPASPRCRDARTVRRAGGALALLTAFAGASSARPARQDLLWSLDAADTRHPAGSRVEACEVSLDGRIQPGVLAHAPSRVRFGEVDVATGARLELSFGIPVPGQGGHAAGLEAAEAGGSVEFLVAVESGGETFELMRRVAAPGPSAHGRASLELGRWSGKRVAVVLETRGDGRAAWGDLVLSPAAPLWSRPVQATELTLDLAALRDGGGAPIRLAAAGPGMLTFEAEAAPLDPPAVVAVGGGGVRVEVPLASSTGLRVHAAIEEAGDVEVCAAPPGGLRGARFVAGGSVPRVRTEGASLLLAVVDTTRADGFGAYGGTDPTPHFDRLSRRGSLHTIARAQASWTLPSVTSMMTLRYPSLHASPLQHREPPGETLPAALTRRGLTTVCVVANPVLAAEGSPLEGFESFVSLPHASGGTVNAAFRAWLDQEPPGRWFGYLHYLDPHFPYVPPRSGKEAGTIDPLASDESWMARIGMPGLASELELAALRRAYASELVAWDASLGELALLLRSRGLLERTVLAVTADHGEEFMEHGLMGHGHQLYDETLQVPMLVVSGAAASPVPAGLVNEPVELRSFLERSIALAGMQPSLDAAPASPGGAGSIAIMRAIGGATPRRGLTLSVAESEWKLVERDGAAPELYHLPSDPAESRDRSLEFPAVATRLHERLVAVAGAQPSAPPSAPEGRLEDAMRALGYVAD